MNLPLTAEELAGLNIFTEGEHTIRGYTKIRADGNAVVYAYDNV